MLFRFSRFRSRGVASSVRFSLPYISHFCRQIQQPTQPSLPAMSAEESLALQQVVNIVRTSPEGSLPLAELLTALPARVKDCVFRSGKGLDNFLSASSELTVEVKSGIKRIVYRLMSESNKPQALDIEELKTSDDIMQRIQELTNVGKWRILGEIVQGLYPSQVGSVSAEAKKRIEMQLLYFLRKHHEKSFWFSEDQMFISPRAYPYADSPPPMAAEKTFGRKIIVPSPQNCWGGWGSPQNIPTAEDVYEILKYVPLNWTGVSSIQIAADIRKKHIRVASITLFLRRLPMYFEIRNIAGSFEVRRAVCLHPEEHGMTLAQAKAWIDQRIARGVHNSVALHDYTTEQDGVVGSSAAQNASGGLLDNLSTDGIPSSISPQHAAMFKFLDRVTPGYFVPLELLMQRWKSKGIPNLKNELTHVMMQSASTFEVLNVKNLQLFRKKIGIESDKWRSAFTEDFLAEGHENMLYFLMCCCCALWDRPEYLYVRLPDDVKTILKGYDNMVKILKAHPRIFICGERFYRRVDLSDPSLGPGEPEPQGQEASLNNRRAEENPYLTAKEVATVFHYVTPAAASLTAAHYLDASSPAMKSVLPPKIVGLLQQFPEYFRVKETSPGIFLISKQRDLSSAAFAGGVGDTTLTFEETVKAVAELIPPSGVEIGQLQTWSSMDLTNAVRQYMGGYVQLILTRPDVFKIVEDMPGTRIVHLTKSDPS